MITATEPQTGQSLDHLLPRAWAGGLVPLGVVGGIGFALGVAPPGATVTILAAAATALVVGALGCLVLVRGTAPKPGGMPSFQFQAAIAMDFGLKLLAVGAGIGLMYLWDMKFPLIATFGIAFAAFSLAFQLGSSVALNRSLARRAAARITDSTGST